MNPTLGIVLFWAVLLGLAWLAVRVAREDGFFTSLCTLIILFAAYQFTRHEWGFFHQVLLGSGMTHLQAVSTAYWIAFLVIVGPGILAARLLAKPKVPFPHPVEHYGTVAIGICAAVLMFATLVHWIYHIDFLMQALLEPLRLFKPLFDILGYRSERFG